MSTLPIAILAAIAALAVGWWVGRRAARTEVKRLWNEREGWIADRARLESQAEGLRASGERQTEELEELRGRCGALSEEKTRADEQLKASQTALAGERELLKEAREKLSDAFKSLAADILKENNSQFLGLANREFSAREESIGKLLTPVRETLNKLETDTQQLEVKREGAYQKVLDEIKDVKESHQRLSTETAQLVQALRAPKARGNWGELQLQRCIEFAGMVEHCSFDVQTYMRGNADDAAQRPDVVVQLPNGRCIVIDAKTPLEAFLSAMSTTDEVQRTALLERHALQVRTHLDQLGGKRYWERFRNSPDFVVCFLPSEVLFSAALEQDPSLIEIGSQLNVILATPTTLIALLKAVAYGWQQMEITRNAIEICETGEKLYKKLAGAQNYFSKMGSSLKSAVGHYNSLVGAVEGHGSVFPLADRLHELKIGREEIAEIEQVESTIRELQSNHWDDPVALAAAEDGGDD